MKILHLISGPRYTGTGAVAISLAEQLARRGHDTHVACPTWNGTIAEFARRHGLGGPHVLNFDINGYPQRLSQDVRRLRRVVREADIDVIHCHRSVDHLIAWLALRGPTSRSALVRTFHEPLGRRESYFAGLLLDRATACLTTVSQATAARLRAQLPRLNGNVYAVAGAVDTRRFTPGDGAPGRQRAGVPPGRLVVGMNSKLARDRGVEQVMRAFAALVQQAGVPDAHLLLVGSENPEPYKKLSRKLGIAERTSFHTEYFDIVEMLRAMDVAVQMVPGNDGSARGVLELMSLGKPVVAPGVGSLAEIVQAGWGVPLKRPAELCGALQTLLCDAGLRRTLGRAARARVLSHHDVDAWARSYESIYARAVSETRRRR